MWSDRPPLDQDLLQHPGASQKSVECPHKFTTISYTCGKAAKAESEVSRPQHGKKFERPNFETVSANLTGLLVRVRPLAAGLEKCHKLAHMGSISWLFGRVVY